jgi:hypothetical protein
MKFIATPDQIQTRQIQQANMQIQVRHLLAQLDRRMQVAIDHQNHYLLHQLQTEQEFLIKQL